MDITNNEAAYRYETDLDGDTAFVNYRLQGDQITFTHTEVPEALEGRGVGSALAKFVLNDARTRGLRVVARCPFIAAYIERHPEYEDLLAKA